MSEAFWTHTFEILAMLLVAFLLGLLLGYILWYKWRRMYIDLQSEHERLMALHRDLEKDHASLRYKAGELEKDNAELRRRVMSLEGDVAVSKNKLAKCVGDLAAAMDNDKGAGPGKKSAAAAAPPAEEAAVAMSFAAAPPVMEMPAVAVSDASDDLRKVEGIGPKIAQLCNGIGIWTWRQLAGTPVETLQKMLDDAGPNFRIADPATWPAQAEMAANGEWDKLREYQEFLLGGKDPV